MPECSFCGERLKPGTGSLFVKRDGTALFFCSKRCEKNLLKLKRAPTSTKWTQAYRQAKEAAKPGKKPEKKPEKRKERAEKPKKAKKKRTRKKKKKK